MARRFRPNFRRSSRGKSAISRQRAWFGTLVDASQGPGTFAVSQLLQPSDYAQGNLASKALLETIYLELAVGPAAAAGSAVNWAIFGILVVDKDVGVGATQNDPDNATNLAQERWLWTARIQVPVSTSNWLPPMSVHVKQRVKLDDTQVRFVASNSDPAQSYDYSFHARCLVRT